jgi:predicted O-linked N-acetylglucosamine transferase (SPINDLY family)
MNAIATAKFIYGKGIDILIDLAGHTTNNRLDVFALTPAPIQMTYLGYPGSTGLSSVQYRITDSIADSPNTKQYYSEHLYRMPKCFLLYQSSNTMPTPRQTPKQIIFGSLNKEAKTTIETIAVWRAILHARANTRLMILMKSDTPERRQFYAEQLNVANERLIFVPYLETEAEYQNLFSKIDILLDPFPYSGTTTTCNALDASIPVVTKYHPDYHSHNVSASLLMHSGLPELVAYSDEEYIDIVLRLTDSSSKIDEYKRTVSTKFRQLMEPKAFMEAYENMLIKVHQQNSHDGRKPLSHATICGGLLV